MVVLEPVCGPCRGLVFPNSFLCYRAVAVCFSKRLSAFAKRFDLRCDAAKIEWKKVLTLLGEGSYQIKCVSTSIFGGTTTQVYPGVFCLSQYTVDRADNTVRIEYTINGKKSEVDYL